MILELCFPVCRVPENFRELYFEREEERSRSMDLFWSIVSNILRLTAGYFFYKIECAFYSQKRGKQFFFFAWIGISAAATIAVFPRDPVNITVGLLFLTAVNFFFYLKENGL